jgi:hypothetical protein
MSSILADVELQIHTCICYPSIKEFLTQLGEMEPRRFWVKKFLGPLTSMGVRTLDNMEIVSPESLVVLHRLCPLMVMDFYIHVIKGLDESHSASFLAGEKGCCCISY